MTLSLFFTTLVSLAFSVSVCSEHPVSKFLGSEKAPPSSCGTYWAEVQGTQFYLSSECKYLAHRAKHYEPVANDELRWLPLDGQCFQMKEDSNQKRYGMASCLDKTVVSVTQFLDNNCKHRTTEPEVLYGRCTKIDANHKNYQISGFKVHGKAQKEEDTCQSHTIPATPRGVVLPFFISFQSEENVAADESAIEIFEPFPVDLNQRNLVAFLGGAFFMAVLICLTRSCFENDEEQLYFELIEEC